MKKLTSYIAVMLLALGASSVSADQVLRIGVEGAYPPFSKVNADGQLEGFDIEIAQAICDVMGRECEMIQEEWDNMIPSLTNFKYDAIIASMSITPERMEVIDFSNKYYNTPAKFAAKADAGLVDTPEGLAGKVVGVQRATIHHDYMDKKFTGVELKLYGTQEEAYLDLSAGRIDAIMADSIAMDDGFLSTDAGKGFAFFGGDHYDPEIHGIGAGIGVRKEEADLKGAFNAAIKAIRADGTYKEINDKYFAIDIYGAD